MTWTRGWAITGSIAAAVYLSTAALAWITGVSGRERLVFDAIVATFDRHGAFFHWCTSLGSGRVILVAVLFLLVLLPGPSLRRWWLWILVVVAVAVLEGWGKLLVGRPRPEAARAGFPSGHTALAAAFYPMVAYIAAHWMRHRRARLATYGAAGIVVGLVAVSRIVRWMHWPLDVVGGAALGVAVFAAAAWWYERYPARRRSLLEPLAAALSRAIHRHERMIPIPFFALVLATPALGLRDARLDLLFDLAGIACVGAALWLRLWAAEQAPAGHGLAMPPATGPYRHMRHPRQVVYVLIGLGLAALAESSLGLILIPAVLITMYRVVAHVEETRLADRYGAAYAEHCARVPLVPWPTAGLVRDAAAARPWRALARERRFVALTLALAAAADLSDAIPRWF
jgi:undecaprenyl-diphosphatase